ncbi:MAG: OstA-like protein [Bacteroidia bacterium]
MLNSKLSFSQTSRKINVRSANSLEFDSRVDAQRLVGNVVFEHEGTLLYCDSAYLFPDNRMDAYSNVRILSDSVTATGDELEYDGNTRIGILKGNVVMTDPNSRLTSDFLNYNLAQKTASYTTGGKITSKDNELVSKFGQYNSANRMFYFRKDVKLTNPQYVTESDTLHYSTLSEIAYFFGPTTITSKTNKIYCENGFYNTKSDYSEFGKNARFESRGQVIEADTLRYDRKMGVGIGRKNVEITDSSEKVVLRGEAANYSEFSGEMIITGMAEMEREFGKDTLFLHADTLMSVLDTLIDKRTLFAYYHAQFYKSDFQGRCDSLVFSESDSLMKLFRSPVIWNDENQLTADSIRIQLANDELEMMYLIKSGFIVSQVDSVDYDQIRGKNITGYFDDNELKRVLVEGNGESIYYAEDDGGEYIGINKAICSRMMIYLDSSKIEDIVFYVKPEATLFTLEELIGEDRKLRGLRWLGEIRPESRMDIFTWKSIAPMAAENRRKVMKAEVEQ